MQISVTVGLLSGKAATVEAGLDEEVGTLKRRAQTGRLLDAAGSILDVRESIKRARLQSGGSLTLHINRAQVRATRSAFAGILGDGSIVTWGDASHGGDCSAVQGQLNNVQQIQASTRAFAAILDDEICRDLGSCSRWRLQSCCAGSAEECAEDPSLLWCFCRPS
eukprot:s326_g6.t1